MAMEHRAHREPSSFIFTRSTRIWELLAGDVAAAAVSATLVAPTVTIIDRSVSILLYRGHRQPRLTWTFFAQSHC